MSKFRFLLLDANIVIELHRQGIWDKFIELCDVTLTETVVRESDFYFSSDGQRHQIDLSDNIDAGKIRCEAVFIDDIRQFRCRFDSSYLDRLDPGEAESLALLVKASESWQISSSDEIVFKVLGRLGLGEQGISLEEILQKIGLKRNDLKPQYTKTFRENTTRKGQEDCLRNRGLKK